MLAPLLISWTYCSGTILSAASTAPSWKHDSWSSRTLAGRRIEGSADDGTHSKERQRESECGKLTFKESGSEEDGGKGRSLEPLWRCPLALTVPVLASTMLRVRENWATGTGMPRREDERWPAAAALTMTRFRTSPREVRPSQGNEAITSCSRPGSLLG